VACRGVVDLGAAWLGAGKPGRGLGARAGTVVTAGWGVGVAADDTELPSGAAWLSREGERGKRVGPGGTQGAGRAATWVRC
jgi:hypothetical protein